MARAVNLSRERSHQKQRSLAGMRLPPRGSAGIRWTIVLESMLSDMVFDLARSVFLL
jgi:hypothetical protein